MRSPARRSATPNDCPPGDLDRGQTSRDPQATTAPVDLDLDRDPAALDAHHRYVPVDLDGGHRSREAPIRCASVDFPPGQRAADTHKASAGGHLGTDRARGDTQSTRVGADLNGDHTPRDIRCGTVTVPEENGQPRSDTHDRDADPSGELLVVLADSLNDIEGLRKATANQLHSLTREADGKGGKGLSQHSKAAMMLADRLAVLEQFEHKTELQLKAALRAHPLGPWVKRTVGIGEKQGARLIAALGDPYWNHAEDRPRRGPAELWAYCGYAPGQKRTKGVQSNWHAEAKMRAYLCAEAAVKAGVRKNDPDDSEGYDVAGREAVTPYGARYLRARESWQGKDTSDAHKHAHGLRCVAKEILKDLWKEAQAVREAVPELEPPASPTDKLARTGQPATPKHPPSAPPTSPTERK